MSGTLHSFALIAKYSSNAVVKWFERPLRSGVTCYFSV